MENEPISMVDSLIAASSYKDEADAPKTTDPSPTTSENEPVF